MKTNELPINNFLRSPDVQFVIPVYQRNYDLILSQCIQPFYLFRLDLN